MFMDDYYGTTATQHKVSFIVIVCSKLASLTSRYLCHHASIWF